MRLVCTYQEWNGSSSIDATLGILEDDQDNVSFFSRLDNTGQMIITFSQSWTMRALPPHQWCCVSDAGEVKNSNGNFLLVRWMHSANEENSAEASR